MVYIFFIESGKSRPCIFQTFQSGTRQMFHYEPYTTGWNPYKPLEGHARLIVKPHAKVTTKLYLFGFKHDAKNTLKIKNPMPHCQGFSA